MKKLLLLIFLTPLLLTAQENPLNIFNPLEDYVWKAEANWGDGSKFKQEIKFKFSLDDNVVTTESMGFTNTEQTEYGLRNNGIRHYDKETKTINFWEFDVFGGLTKGTVEAEGKNIIYKYNYGGTFVTEMWLYKNETTYTFIVGIYENNKWKQKFLETEFIGTKK